MVGTASHSARGAVATRAVADFERRLERLDRSLSRELARTERKPERSRPRLPLGWLAGGLGLAERLDRIRVSERDDEFGLDLEFEKFIQPFFEFLYRKYWRVEVQGIEHIPSSGPAVLVANHSGAFLPYDGAMLKMALHVDHPAARELRPLVENLAFRLPFVGSLMTRAGGVRACPENAERLLRKGEVIAVFPEGIHGMEKRFSERYRLQRFGRGGFVRLCRKIRAPLIPVAIVGAEEIHPLLGKLERPARALGLPYFPFTPTFPWLGPLGLVPLPTKWTIRFGRPINFRGTGTRNRAGEQRLVDRWTAEVQARIQRMLDDQIRVRKSVFY